LERETKRVAELLLAHAEHHPAHAHPAANMLVDWIGDLLAILLPSTGILRAPAHNITLHYQRCERPSRLTGSDPLAVLTSGDAFKRH
jgi:hypothetical protein